MSGFREASGPERVDLRSIVDLLGGRRALGREPRSALEAHALIVEGLPAKAVIHLVRGFASLAFSPSVEAALGMSLRTFQRYEAEPTKSLSAEQSGRVWKFAEILARARLVFGAQEEAEQWLSRPAMGLEQHRPIDLLVTPAGVDLVEDFLERIEYGVYT